jgi:hypothetical protein
MKPGSHGVRTAWNPGFTTFERSCGTERIEALGARAP